MRLLPPSSRSFHSATYDIRQDVSQLRQEIDRLREQLDRQSAQINEQVNQLSSDIAEPSSSATVNCFINWKSSARNIIWITGFGLAV